MTSSRRTMNRPRPSTNMLSRSNVLYVTFSSRAMASISATAATGSTGSKNGTTRSPGGPDSNKSINVALQSVVGCQLTINSRLDINAIWCQSAMDRKRLANPRRFRMITSERELDGGGGVPAAGASAAAAAGASGVSGCG